MVRRVGGQGGRGLKQKIKKGKEMIGKQWTVEYIGMYGMKGG